MGTHDANGVAQIAVLTTTRCLHHGCASAEHGFMGDGSLFVNFFPCGHTWPIERYPHLADAAAAWSAEQPARPPTVIIAPAGENGSASLYDLIDPEGRTRARNGRVIVSAGLKRGHQAETKIRVETAREIAAAAPEKVDWLAVGLSAAGALTETDGPPKSAGKTTFTMWKYRAMLDRTLFLGLPTAHPGGVLVLTEQTHVTLRETLELTGLLDRDELAFIRWHSHRGVPFAEVMAQAAEECIRRGWRQLCVDTIGQWAGIQGDSENHSGSALAAMEPCQDAAGMGLAVDVLRHDRKGGGQVGESGRGSNAFTGAVDIVLQITRPEGNAPPTHRVLSALSRFRETPARVVIDLTPDGYVCLGDVRAVVASGIRESILEHLPSDPDQSWTFEQIVAACAPDTSGRKPARSTVQSALDGLVSSDHGPALVGTETLPQRGKPKVYWRTPAEPRVHSAGVPALFVSADTPSLYQAETNTALGVPESIVSAGCTGHQAETNGGLMPCARCGAPANRSWKGENLCFGCHPLGTAGMNVEVL